MTKFIKAMSKLPGWLQLPTFVAVVLVVNHVFYQLVWANIF
jgi:hypothetical protein